MSENKDEIITFWFVLIFVFKVLTSEYLCPHAIFLQWKGDVRDFLEPEFYENSLKQMSDFLKNTFVTKIQSQIPF